MCGPREAGCPPPPMQSRPPRCPLTPAPLSHSPLCLPLSWGISSLETPGPSALLKPNPNPDHRPTLSLDSRPYPAPQAPCPSPGPDPTWTETGPAAWSRPPTQMALAHLSHTGPSRPAPGLPSSSRPLGPSGCAGRTQCWGCPRLTQPRCSGLGQTCVPASGGWHAGWAQRRRLIAGFGCDGGGGSGWPLRRWQAGWEIRVWPAPCSLGPSPTRPHVPLLPLAHGLGKEGGSGRAASSQLWEVSLERGGECGQLSGGRWQVGADLRTSGSCLRGARCPQSPGWDCGTGAQLLIQEPRRCLGGWALPLASSVLPMPCSAHPLSAGPSPHLASPSISPRLPVPLSLTLTGCPLERWSLEDVHTCLSASPVHLFTGC